MNLLLINPNTSQSLSDLLKSEARLAASPGTTITVVTAPFGVEYIETRFERLIGAYAAATLAAENAHAYDAIVVAAFLGDTGVDGLREVLHVPVVGLTEAGLMAACLLGKRFSIIALTSRVSGWYRECVYASGMIDRLASMRHLDRRLQDIGNVQFDHAERLEALCLSAVEDDGADVIILAGAPLAGLARSIKERIPVPIVDSLASAVCHAQNMLMLAPAPARRGDFAPPPIKPTRGLPEAMERLLKREAQMT